MEFEQIIYDLDFEFDDEFVYHSINGNTLFKCLVDVF